MLRDLYPTHGQPSNPPTWDDVERLALHYPHVQQAVALARDGVLTREQALIVAVFALAESYRLLFGAEVKRRQLDPACGVLTR